MSDREAKPEPRVTAAAERAKAEREAKLAQALRENLKRRKAQQRGRAEEEGGA